MKFIKFILLFIQIIFAILIIKYTIVVQNNFLSFALLVLYYVINIYILISFKKYNKFIFLIAFSLSISYLICCIGENLLLGLPIIFLGGLFYKNSNSRIKFIIVVVFIIQLLYILLSFYLGVSFTKTDEMYNFDRTLSVITILANAGATGSDFNYYVQTPIINNLLSIRKRLHIRNAHLVKVDKLVWISNNILEINGVSYTIRFP